MFNRLRTKLAVLYAALFAATLLLVSLAVYTAISSNAARQGRNELAASGTVFDRIWDLRSEQLRDGAALLSRDFGFREAVATGDQATIASAMDNLRRRFGLDLAFIVGVDGAVTAGEAAGLGRNAERLALALDSAEAPSGVLMLDGAPHQVIAAPILSPDLIGWVVFAKRLDGAEMSALEKLSAIPLEAIVLHRAKGGWVSAEIGKPDERARIDSFVAEALATRATAPRVISTPTGPAVALVKPLPALIADDGAVLLLRYPLAQALAPYQPLMITIGAAGLLGLAFVILGSWALARGVTRPISALDLAAHRLQAGEEAHVAVETRDELGRLAESFNTMATEIRERERRITDLALTDAETGLPNRLALERALDGGDRATPRFVAALGFERFAHVRGAIGYGLAAELVREVGARLGGLMPDATLARVSSGVLGLVFEAADEAAAQVVVVGLLEALETPVQLSGHGVDVALSAGVAPVKAADASLRSALERADIALDQARAARRKTAVFDAAAYGDPSSNLALMSGMLNAIERGEMELYHQPKYDLRKRGVSGVEALVRWRHPVRGMLPPDLFIPMAEETGHIRTLTEWVLRQALDDQATMARAGHAVAMSVNISGRLLGDREFADFAVAIAREASAGLCFEVTETAVIENPDLALNILDRFTDAGIAISIDDFGTGLSSLAYLKQIRGEELKIDKSLVAGVTESQRDALIVRSTIDLAHSLGFKVTAEGVETNAVFALLAAMGCDTVQGYLVARPQPVADLLAFLGEAAAETRSYG